MAKKSMSKSDAASSKISKLKITPKDAVYIGLDVHKNSIHVALWRNDGLATWWVGPASADKLISILEPIREAVRCIAYEAGPSGYGLWRKLQAAGFPALIVAPNCIVRDVRERAKTDRVDCRHLAERAAKHDLRGIQPPSEEEESFRALARHRHRIMRKRVAVKSAIKLFLQYNSLSEPEGLSHWSKASLASLSILDLPSYLRMELDEMLSEYYEQSARIKRLDRELEQSSSSGPLGKTVSTLCTHPGVGKVVAIRFAAEIYQPERFADTSHLASYLGLAPGIRQSGETSRRGGLMRSGQAELRSLLVQAAWTWVRYDSGAHNLWARLLRNTGCAQKAIIGVARRLSGNLWQMLMRESVYRPYRYNAA